MWMFSKEISVLWSAVWAFFSKFLMKRSIACRFPYRNQKLRLDLQSGKTIFSLKKISLNIQTFKLVYRSSFKKICFASCPSEKLSCTVMKIISQKKSTVTIGKLTSSTKLDNALQTIVNQLRGNTMCRAFTPDCRYDNGSFELIGNVYCSKWMCLVVLCMQKRCFLISWQKWPSMSSMQFHVSGAKHCFWRTNIFVFFEVRQKSICFWRDPKINSKRFWRCSMSSKFCWKQKCVNDHSCKENDKICYECL